MATIETWRSGPMGYDDAGLTDEECDERMDALLRKHAIAWHKKHRKPGTCPDGDCDSI